MVEQCIVFEIELSHSCYHGNLCQDKEDNQFLTYAGLVLVGWQGTAGLSSELSQAVVEVVNKNDFSPR